ncbi:MAG: hypothetical protein AB2L14_30975 [Candidatus Xenobiia bacterium LiM19]
MAHWTDTEIVCRVPVNLYNKCMKVINDITVVVMKGNATSSFTSTSDTTPNANPQPTPPGPSPSPSPTPSPTLNPTPAPTLSPVVSPTPSQAPPGGGGSPSSPSPSTPKPVLNSVVNASDSDKEPSNTQSQVSVTLRGLNFGSAAGAATFTPSFTACGTAGFSAGTATFTSLYVYNGTPYVAYSAGDDGYKGKVKRLKPDGSGWEAACGDAYVSISVESGM